MPRPTRKRPVSCPTCRRKRYQCTHCRAVQRAITLAAAHAKATGVPARPWWRRWL